MPVVNLTARFVESAKADGARREIRDAKVEGLELRVSPSGTKAWVLRYRRKSDKTKRTLTLGTFPDMRLEEAREAAEDARRVAAKGGDPAGEKQVRKAAETFSDLADEWIERHGKPNKSVRALADDQSMLDRHIRPEIGAMKAAEITKRDVIRLLDNVAAKPDARQKADQRKGAATRKLTHRPNRVFELVRAIFRWAVGRDLLKVDPTLGLSPPIKKEKPRERELSPEEIRILWLALDGAPITCQKWKRVEGELPMRRVTALTMKLALVTGQRIGEVTGIPMSELDLNDIAPTWKLPGTRTKNGEPHRVPLSPLALRIIAEARELSRESAWLFPSPTGDGPIDPHAATKALERARRVIGIADFRVHDLRRTAATRMEEMGVLPHVISQILNHVSVSKSTITKKVYSRYTYDREKRQALEAWGARLERVLAEKDSTPVVSLNAARSQS